MDINKAFYDISSSFRNRLQSLHILNRHTIDNDQEEIEVAKKLFQDLPISMEDREISDFSYLIDRMAVKLQTSETVEIEEIVKEYGAEDLVEFNPSKTAFIYKPEVTKALEDWGLKDKIGLKKLISYQRKSRINSPTRGDIIRQGTLVYLVTYFEMLIGDLLRAIFTDFPEMISREKTFKYEDLLQLETLDAITQQAISDEADALLRLGYKDIPKAISKRTGIDVTEIKSYSQRMIELFERRNVFVHNNGKVDHRYIKNVSKDYVEEIRARIDLPLSTPIPYLEKQISTVLIVGTIISQRIWRKYVKDSKLADYFLTELIFEKLVEGRYPLVNNLSDFALNVNFSNKSSRYAVLINNAIAYDKLDEKVKKERELKKIGNIYNLPIGQQIAYYSVNLEKEKALELLRNAIPNGDIDEVDLQDWPAFEYLGNDPEFQKIKQTIA